jgi:hypothetical protein
MSDDFVDYIEAQINMIRSDIGEEACRDSEKIEIKIIEWIEKNAPAFRAGWEKKQNRKIMKNALE